MGNFFEDVAGGFLGQGPGTETVSGYEMLPTEKRQGLDRLRTFLGEDEPYAKGYGGFFARGYEALPGAERTRRTEELSNVYKAQFNPYLQDIFSRAEGELSKSGLLTSTRAAALKGQLGSKLALESMLPTVQYGHQMEDVNRAETLRNRLAILDRALGVDYPGQVEIGKPTSTERGLGGFLGKGVGERAGEELGNVVFGDKKKEKSGGLDLSALAALVGAPFTGGASLALLGR